MLLKFCCIIFIAIGAYSFKLAAMSYQVNADRYQNMSYLRCGRSGLKLPRLTLGLWHNFGDVDDFENGRRLLHHAFDAGLSNYYDPAVFRRAVGILAELGTPCLIHQPRYSMLDRKVEGALLAAQEELGVGSIVFSPLEQGILTDRYLNGIPADSRAGRADSPFLQAEKVAATLEIVQALHKIALERGQSLAQMAITWVLRQPMVTSALIGASQVAQIEDLLPAVNAPGFSEAELQMIDTACGFSS